MTANHGGVLGLGMAVCGAVSPRSIRHMGSPGSVARRMLRATAAANRVKRPIRAVMRVSLRLTASPATRSRQQAVVQCRNGSLTSGPLLRTPARHSPHARFAVVSRYSTVAVQRTAGWR